MGVLNLFKRSVVVVTLVLLAGLALTPSARAVDPGFPPPTGDPSIIPAGAHLDRIWDGGGVLTEGVSAGPDGVGYLRDNPLFPVCEEPSGQVIQARDNWRYKP